MVKISIRKVHCNATSRRYFHTELSLIRKQPLDFSHFLRKFRFCIITYCGVDDSKVDGNGGIAALFKKKK